ncbi:hypothetical protein AXG93_4123s1340 [Marchantia polymorpha subsp. ruderalis]|uniref:DNA 3'-5' helicase n=1 Tax=Marchantia polymorpha subsp. ruderalis TaxID=1480154 RepID=A0A176WJZ1_MARPO|nr:hypothetical protein AXG93_4123s1340 [Marchantia polymorpha subsp. ruderalis]
MDPPEKASSLSRIQSLKTDLKQWERDFQKQNGRVPAKQDIQACPSIRSLYLEYGRLKQSVQKENGAEKINSERSKVGVAYGKENSWSGLSGGGKSTPNNSSSISSTPETFLRSQSLQIAEQRERRAEPVMHPPDYSRLIFPAKPSNSDDSEDGSYISATPPKRVGPKVEQQSTPISSFRPLRRPLLDISSQQNESSRAPASSQNVPSQSSSVLKVPDRIKRKAPEMDAVKTIPPKIAVYTSNRIQSRVENSSPLAELPQVPGFVIKRRRPGMHFEESNFACEHEALPAGFSASVMGSSLIRKEYQNPSDSVNDSSKAEVESRAGGESATFDTLILSPALGTETETGDSRESLTAVSNISQIDPEAIHCAPEPQSGSIAATQPLSSDSESVEFVHDSHSPLHNKVDASPTVQDLDRDLSGKALQKLTVVVLKQMLLKRGLSLVGNKATLISRLSAALDSQGSCNGSRVEIVEGSIRGKKQKEKVAGACEPVEETKLNTSSKGEEEGSHFNAEGGDVELSHCSRSSINLRSGKVVTLTSTTSIRTRTRSGRSAVRSEETLLSSSEKTQHKHHPGDNHAPSSIASSKAVRKRSREDAVPPVVLQNASCESTTTSCDEYPSADLSFREKTDSSKSVPVVSIGDVNNMPSTTSSKRTKCDKPSEEFSWAKPKALQRRSTTQKTKTISTRISHPNRVHTQAVKPGERNNFVKLNLNGRGGGRRKFVNKTRFKKPGAYGRRGFRGKKSRKPALDEDNDALEQDHLHADEVDNAGGSEKKGSRSNRTRFAVRDIDICAKAGFTVADPVEDSKIDLPPGLSEVLERVLHNPSNENLLEVLDMAFGFKAFRAGQLEATKRILALQSTMVMLPTGAGKSLCYQLPALILPGVTLVISPLIALMTDQLRHLPPSLPGALMSSAQTSQESSSTVARLRAGLVKVKLFELVLFISPERLCSESFQRILAEIPKISLAVVDEAHCLSEWLRALLSMLQEKPYSEARSIIIYCTFQVEADNISDFLQQNGIQAKSYHAKKTSQERSRIFDQFCSNRLRVVVATVAFGMGLDKSDVRAVIHYNMPRSLEHYVQETGRAGRDGKAANCHLFLDDNDFLKLRSLAHSEGVDEYAVGKVLSRIFSGKQESSKVGNPSSIIIETATKEFDIKEEVLETVLSYLEVGDVQYVKSVSKMNVTCTLSFHRSSPASLAERSSHVTAILRRSQEKQGRYSFDLLALATHLQISIFDMQFELRRLQSAGEITCEYGDPALCFTVTKFPEDIRVLTSAITKRLNGVENCKVKKVDAMYAAALAAVRMRSEGAFDESISSLSSEQASFQNTIKMYFDEDEGSLPSPDLPSVIQPNRNFLRADIKDFVRTNKHVNLTGRAVARIFYGIWSPAYPYSDWCKNHSWGKYEGVDFGAIKEIATAELLAQHSATRLLQSSEY